MRTPTAFRTGLAALLVAATAGAAAADNLEVRMATLAPDGSSWMKILGKGSAEVATKTENRVTIKYYAGGVQGDERDVVRKINLGQLDGAALTSVGLSMVEESIRVLELPRLFNSVEELDYVADKVWPYYQKKFEKKGFTLQDRGEVGWVYFMTKSEPKSIDALKSSKMWLWGDDAIMKTTFKRLGMSGVPLGVPEVEPALTTGRIDGCYGSPLAAVALQWNTKIKYVTSMPISFSIGATIIKTDSLNKISADDQKLMAKIAKGMQKTLRKQIRKDNDSALKQMERKGVKISATSDAMITDVDKARPGRVEGAHRQGLLQGRAGHRAEVPRRVPRQAPGQVASAPRRRPAG
jgi:TRAP-type C4-dicarboxylate transport system substrate-binding protein